MVATDAAPEVKNVGALGRVRSFALRQWPLWIVLILFGASSFAIPTLVPIATTDDWGYTRSVEILLDERRLTVFPVVAATAVFQIGWGALFGLIFGMSLGIVRVSTIVMVTLGGTALYALLRELGVSRGRSALGTAAYLFNPISFVLAYSFMTDPFLTALVIGSTYFYVRGLRDGRADARMILLGSAVAGCAFLTRQQGALIPLGVLSWLVVSRRLWFTWRSVRLVALVWGIPLLTMAGYYLWLTFVNDVPAVQQSFTEQIRHEGLDAAWLMARQLTLIALMYLGFFLLPLTLGGIFAVVQCIRTSTRLSVFVTMAWLGLLAVGLAVTLPQGRRFPYAPQFMGSGGLGPVDVLGSRPRVFHEPFFTWATVVVGISAVLVAVLVGRGFSLSFCRDWSAAGIVLGVAVWQAIGIVPPSYHYIRRGYSLDRYLLPLLPLGICLLLWATRDLRFWKPIGWVVIAAFAAFSIAGTRDYLVMMDTVWDSARDAEDRGIPLTQIDAGASWDGYHMYTYGLDHNITRARTRHGHWWLAFYGKAIDSSYVVSSKFVRGYVPLHCRQYDSWLLRDEVGVCLYRRNDISLPGGG